MDWRGPITAALFAAAVLSVGFWTEPMFPLGDYRWGILAGVALFGVLATYTPVIYRRIKAGKNISGLVEDEVRDRIAAFEAKQGKPTQVILHPGATYNDFRGASGEWHLEAAGQVEVISPRRISVQTLGITAPAMEAIATVNKRTPRADESDDR